MTRTPNLFIFFILVSRQFLFSLILAILQLDLYYVEFGLAVVCLLEAFSIISILRADFTKDGIVKIFT